MRKIISLILIVVLLLSITAMGYAFEFERTFSDELKEVQETKIPEYENKLDSMAKSYADLNANYDIISGKVVSYNPFIISLDLDSKTSGVSSLRGFPIDEYYAKISDSDFYILICLLGAIDLLINEEILNPKEIMDALASNGIVT